VLGAKIFPIFVGKYLKNGSFTPQWELDSSSLLNSYGKSTIFCEPSMAMFHGYVSLLKDMLSL
jgi:hypothetical protein